VQGRLRAVHSISQVFSQMPSFFALWAAGGSVPAMHTASRRALLPTRALALLALVAVGLSACGKGGAPEALSGGGPIKKLAPVAAQGALSVATRNTTRVGGADAAADAAGVARTAYPGLTPATRPQAVVVVNAEDWPAALAASVLAGAPTGAPILFSEGNTLPEVTSQTLEAMHPLGAPALGGVQVIEIGTSAALPGNYVTRSVPVADSTPALSAAAIEQLLLTLDRTSAPTQVIVLSAYAAKAMAMPAAGLAAESGSPILFVTPPRVPPATVATLRALHRPSIFVINARAVGGHALHQLRRLGPVTAIRSSISPIPSAAAVQNAIEVARFTNGTFGWGVKEPGHGLVFANVARPLDAPAAALLSATGDYGPLLLLASAAAVPPALAKYLSDIQPAYSTAPQFQPVRGSYNHGWLIGDEAAITAITQAEIDSVLEIHQQTPEESSVSQVE
jgi:hypothetical protein